MDGKGADQGGMDQKRTFVSCECERKRASDMCVPRMMKFERIAKKRAALSRSGPAIASRGMLVG